MDRGLIAASVIKDGIQNITDPPMDETQFFFLPSVFMVGMMIASPIFASCTRTVSYFRLLSIGLSVWALATAGCAIAWNYSSMMVFRTLVGVGEASFCSVAAPCIDGVAPPGRKSTWLAIFFMMTPVGTAFGYVYGGVMWAVFKSWRACFLIEGILMIPFVVFCAIAKPVKLGQQSVEEAPEGTAEEEDGLSRSNRSNSTGMLQDMATQDQAGQANREETMALMEEEGPKESVMASMWGDTKCLLTNPVFMLGAIGYIFFSMTMGVVINAGPTAGKALFPDFQHHTGLPVDVAFGLLTIITGVVGTCSGGLLLDRLGSSMQMAFIVCAVAGFIGYFLLVITFQMPTEIPFMLVLLIAELSTFATVGPITSGYMWSVPAERRPMACAMITILIHAFGDVPSPPIAGFGADTLRKKMHYNRRDSWRTIITLSMLGVGMSSLLWGVCAIVAGKARDYGKVVEEDRTDSDEGEVNAQSTHRGGNLTHRRLHSGGAEEPLLSQS